MSYNNSFIPAVPVMQVRPGCLLYYDHIVVPRSRSTRTLFDCGTEVQVNKKYTGKMNDKSKSKLRFCLNLLVEQAKEKEVENPTTGKFYRFKINFITLTLSAAQRDVSDREIKSHMLAPWIRNMRNVYHLRSYVWRAERQKNGNIHFHFSTDTYIPYDAIRDSWNYQQSKFHFIAEFQHRNKSQFPNSTDVHAVYNVKNLASYLVKYMVKDEKGLESIEGKVWDCSANLKTKERVVFEMSVADFSLFDKLRSHFKNKVYYGEQCSIIQLTKSEMREFLPRSYYDSYLQWLESVYRAGEPNRPVRVPISV